MLSGVVCEALEAGAMKVALFVHCFFPNHFYGTETYTLELARNLLALGHQPIVVTAIFPGEPTTGRILSTDQRDFRTYRWKRHKPFKNLLPDLG